MPANKVRIIGGSLRHRLIQFPADPLVRPTPDRVRETLFNWLGQTLDGLACLDLFAGSGALGLEAASRGAGHVVMVEHDRAAAASLVQNAAALAAAQVRVIRADALEFLRAEHTQYDIIFVDPPFSADLFDPLLPLLAARTTQQGRVYYESAADLQWPDGWRVLRQSRAGQVRFQLVQRASADPHEVNP